MFSNLVGQAATAFQRNARWVVFFSLPFLIAFPLALLLPNYAALGAIFLRPGSIGYDAGPLEVGVMLAAIAISTLLFSFAVVAVNSIVKVQKTFGRFKFTDFERMEGATMRLFAVYFVAFLLVFAIQLLLYQSHVFSDAVRNVVNALFALLVSLVVLFVPQAIVLDGRGIESSVVLASRVLTRKPGLVVKFLLLSVVLVVVNAAIFLALQSVFFFAPLLGIVTNALLIMPFLELLKIQIYLRKYTLL